MIYIITFIVVGIYLYTFSCLVREIYETYNSYSINLDNNKKQVLDSTLAILIYLVILMLVITYWIYNRKGFQVGYSLNKFDEDLVLISFSINLVSTSITRYFRKSRLGEDFLLDYKYEIKRNISFKFYEESSFETIVNKFIKDQKELGKTPFYIKSTEVDLKYLSELKSGETKDFGGGSTLVKVSNEVEHNYLYKITEPIIFGIHTHKFFSEHLVPLKRDLDLWYYEPRSISNFYKPKKLIHSNIKAGDSYLIPKNIKHGIIVALDNEIGLKWI